VLINIDHRFEVSVAEWPLLSVAFKNAILQRPNVDHTVNGSFARI
jgi:hypothetical protein